MNASGEARVDRAFERDAVSNACVDRGFKTGSGCGCRSRLRGAMWFDPLASSCVGGLDRVRGYDVRAIRWIVLDVDVPDESVVRRFGK